MLFGRTAAEWERWRLLEYGPSSCERLNAVFFGSVERVGRQILRESCKKAFLRWKSWPFSNQLLHGDRGSCILRHDEERDRLFCAD